MKKMFVYHNLGLGDHIICNALVRHFTKQHGSIHLFCKYPNVESVKWMFYDINVIIVPVESDSDVEKILALEQRSSIIRIGCTGSGWKDAVANKQDNYDKVFYSQANISYDKRWDDYFVRRNTESEKALFNKYKIKENEYIFLHDDENRDYVIDKSKIKGHVPIVDPKIGLTKNIFDYCYLIQNCKEFHCIDSSFKVLVEHIETNAKLVFHSYAKRKHVIDSIGWGLPRTNKVWEIV